MKRNFSKNSDTNKKVDSTILLYATESGSILIRMVDKLTFNPRDFFECTGFTTNEVEELIPMALDIRAELIREYKYNRPDFRVADTPITEFDEALFEAANSDVFVCEVIYSHLKKYFDDENRQKPGKVVALIANSESKVRFGGCKAIGFSQVKANFIAKNENLCREIAGIIANHFGVNSAKEDDEPEEKETAAPRVSETVESNDSPLEVPVKDPLANRLVAYKEDVSAFLNAYEAMKQHFCGSEIEDILHDKKLQQFVALCSQIS